MSEQESKLGKILGGVIFFAVAAVLGWLACGMYANYAKKMMAAKMQEMAAAQASAITVAVTNPVMTEINVPDKYIAHVEAMAEVDLRPQVDGYIKEILFKEGDLVQEGQILYLLDDEKYQAIVGQAKADLNAAETEARRAKRYFDRMESADKRGITQLERDNAEAAADRAEAAVMQAKANLVVAEYNCKKAKVVAPISGKIGKTAVHVGDLVSPSSVALAHIVQIDPIRVTFPITDRAFTSYQKAKLSGKTDALRMRLMLPDGNEYTLPGEEDFDDNMMSKETATIIMRLKFANPERLLVPNEYVDLLTDYKDPPKYLSVPQQCVLDLAGGNQAIWIVKDDMTVEQRVVTTRETFNGWTPILTGVKEGETVVMSGMGKLGPGMKVQFVTPTSNYDINPNHVPPINEL